MLFGTDGIRGIYGAGLDDKLAFSVGVALAASLGGGRVLLGLDTRESGRELYTAMRDGLLYGGADVLSLGILPTPAVSYLVTKFDAAAGVMITASHNPPEYNGIKFFRSGGTKLEKSDEEKIAHYISNPPKKAMRGRLDSVMGGGMYLDHISSAVGEFDCVSVAIDCGHGALYSLAAEFFSRRAAKTKVLCGTPDGACINCGCGALYPNLAAEYTKNDYAIGFSFDGDGDRLSVSKNGEAFDGDSVLYNLSELTGARSVVGTVLSNSALERELIKKDKAFYRTDVGDKYISRLMQAKGHMLGGEQSGHYIIRPYSCTGDALLSAALIAKYVSKNNTLERLHLTPQKSISKFALPDTINRPDISALIAKSQAALAPSGRLIARMSGTEPKLRITVESEDPLLINQILSEFEKALD